MEFNFINIWIMLSGIFMFLGGLGGICFLVYSTIKFIRRFCPRENEEQLRCESCKSYKTCVDLTSGDLPDYPCAYWEKKKP